ncbi:DUF4340 domain-containing protein [Ectopseudomonas alcaliphila]|uniref:DUF4340 domain-containing protein n=1 Tax=Ectopseudomonas alcaliphila TaxID=101564 RepID=UPI002789ED4E|nr:MULTISPECIES: DUF4340 domain-containing protein [Pseudomonas]MDP9941839.1 hypothetical protein [Pseudomonas sp. 3400]MDR7014058.1 hypothetical protein [Pseudomonas alcaliphila]
MGRKGLIALVVIVLLCVLGYAAVQHSQQQSMAQVERAPWLAVEQGYLNTLQALEIEQPGQPPVRIERREDGWVVPAKADYPAAPQPLADLLRALREARTVEAKTANAQRHARLGLAEEGEADEQALRLKLQFEGHPDLGLRLGNPSQQGGGQLVRRAGEDQVWLIDQQLQVPTRELDWLDRRISDIPFTRIARLELRYADGEKLTLTRADAQQYNFAVAELRKEQKLSFEGAANAVALVFSNLQFADAAPLAQVGFKQAPMLQFSLSGFAEEKLEGALYKQGEQYWLVLGEREGFSAEEVSARDDWAYRLEPDQVQRLAKKLRDLLAKSS